MKAIGFHSFGAPEVLQLTDAAHPEVRPNDLLVRNYAAGVNRADIIQRHGGYGRAYFGDSDVMGLEIAGEVIGIGSQVQGFRPGDRVMGIVGGGGYAELVRIDHRMAMPVPKRFPYAEAAAIPEVFVTAHEALFHLAALQAGERVLIHAAASGVGTAAVQLAAAAGAKVFVTASGGKLPQLRDLGADVLIDYKRQDFSSAVTEATGGEGVNVIVDFVGAPYFERNIHALANGGRLIQVGMLGGSTDARVPLERILYGHLKVMGTVMKSRTPDEKRAMIRRFRDRWLARFEDGSIRPVIDSVFPLAKLARRIAGWNPMRAWAKSSWTSAMGLSERVAAMRK